MDGSERWAASLGKVCAGEWQGRGGLRRGRGDGEEKCVKELSKQEDEDEEVNVYRGGRGKETIRKIG